MTQTWWLSFCDGDRPIGEQFLGAAILDVDEQDIARSEGVRKALRARHGLPDLTDPDDRSMSAAIWKSHRYACNPGGEVAAVRIDEAPGFAAHDAQMPRNRLLQKAALIALGLELF